MLPSKVPSDVAHETCRLADKALDIFHHLSQRGSIWPEASATAVRELRDRITRRPSRPPGATSRPQHHTSSSGLDPQANGPSTEPNHTASSTGLPQGHTRSHAMQSTADGSTAPNSTLTQAANTAQSTENVQPFDSASSAQHQIINTPVFDFGNPEWSDFIQANETLNSSAPLPQASSMDPYIGFDIPFWLGQDQYWDMLHDRN